MQFEKSEAAPVHLKMLSHLQPCILSWVDAKEASAKLQLTQPCEIVNCSTTKHGNVAQDIAYTLQ